ncbi:MAG: hypothetical protein QM651_16465 [Rhodoblastus sp.]
MRLIARAAPLLLAAVAALTYGAAASAIASTRSLWIDEVLAVWTARLPTASDVVTAIWNGAEFSPPTYDLLLHALFQAAGSDPLTARLPSIAAVLLAAALIGSIVHRRLGDPFGALAFALILNSALFDYAIQARAYALLAALTAATLVLWAGRGPRGANLRAAGVGVALFCAVSLHFYAIVGYAMFGLMEALRTAAYRRARPAMWIAFVVSGAACAVWAPLIRRLASFNADDAASPDFYGAPTLSRLVEHAQALFVGANAFWLFILVALLILAAAYCVARVSGRPSAPPAGAPEDVTELAIIGVGLPSALPIGFALALCATHVFSARYALAASMGACILFTLAVARGPYRNFVGYSLLGLLCVLPLLRGGPGDLSAAGARLLKAHPSDGPIVIGDGNFFMEMMDAAEPEIRARLVYLRRPSGVKDGDTSSESQLLRLKSAVRTDLPVRDFDSFVADHRAFTVLARPGNATDALSAWFVERGWVSGASSLQPKIALLQVRAP